MNDERNHTSRRRQPDGAPGLLRRLRDAGLRPRRRLGQHFLVDPGVLRSIVDAAALDREDAVLEVGTGPGSLTRWLCERAGTVVSVEIDPAMARFARGELAGHDNLRIVETDALAGKGQLAPAVLEALRPFRRWKLVANLPYSIATPLVITAFSSSPCAALGVVTVQREVAGRLVAAPGGREYGPATLALRFWAETEVLRHLAPGAFVPPPRVASSVIRIRPRDRPLGDPADFPAYSGWVERLFGGRRKQVGGLLRRYLGNEKASEALQWMRVDVNARAESLPPEAFLELARHFPGVGSGSGPRRADRPRAKKRRQ